jgi:hypothetical protein
MQCNVGRAGFNSAPSMKASVLPAPADEPISSMCCTPGVAATRTIARYRLSFRISGGIN